MWYERFSGTIAKVLRKSTSLLAFLLIGLVYFLGVRSERTGFIREVLDPGLKRITRPVLNAFRGSPPKVLQLRLIIDQHKVDSLAAIIEPADGTPRPLTYLPIRIVLPDRQLDARASIILDHVRISDSDAMSFRVQLAPSDTVLGSRGFDLLPVTDGRYLNDWLFQTALDSLGHPAQPTRFVEVKLNDARAALFVLKPQIDAEYVHLWGRGRGPVLGFDDALLRNAERTAAARSFATDPLPQAQWTSAPLRMDLLGQQSDEYLNARGAKAIRALESFRAGNSFVGDVYDRASLARLLALADLFGAQDAIAWDGLRAIADSITGLLIPFPTNGSALEPIRSIIALRTSSPLRPDAHGPSFLDHLFADPAFYSTYIAYLDTFSTEGWLEALLAGIGPELDRQERIVTGAFPLIKLDRLVLEHNRTVIRQTLYPSDLALVFAPARMDRTTKPAAANVHTLPIRVLGMYCGGDTIRPERPITLWPKDIDKPLTYVSLPLVLPATPTKSCGLLVELAGLTGQRSVGIRTWSTFAAEAK